MGGSLMRKWAVAALALVLAVAFVSGCGARRQQPPSGQSGQAKQFTVIGLDYSFEPADITVNEGDEVIITFRNDGALGHTWELPAYNIISDELMTGETQVLRFVADKAGVYEIICGVVGHADLGMVGTLTVNKP